MGSRLGIFAIILFAAPFCRAQGTSGIANDAQPTTVIGPRNLPLHDGAQALIEGNFEKGVKLTLQGLEIAQGRREEEAALSNLCAGYIKLRKFSKALEYCNLVLARNDNNWRGYNNRAVIYIMTKQYDKAEADLLRGEALNPGARTMKVARAMYMDAVHPVRPEVEIDDSENLHNKDSES